MTRAPLISILACLLAASGAASAESLEPPDLTLKRALAAKPCRQFETAQGWVVHRTSPLSDLTGTRADQVTAVDRSRRRYVSLIRQTRPDESATFQVTRYAYADGQFYACAASQAETCKLQPMPQNEVPPEDVTSAWVGLGDLRAPDRGGAEVALAEVPPEIGDAVSAVALTPQGGRTYILYIAADGTIVATDLKNPDRTVRTWLADYKDIDGCATPSTMRIEILPAMPGVYLEWRLESFEYRDWMPPEATRFE